MDFGLAASRRPGMTILGKSPSGEGGSRPATGRRSGHLSIVGSQDGLSPGCRGKPMIPPPAPRHGLRSAQPILQSAIRGGGKPRSATASLVECTATTQQRGGQHEVSSDRRGGRGRRHRRPGPGPGSASPGTYQAQSPQAAYPTATPYWRYNAPDGGGCLSRGSDKPLAIRNRSTGRCRRRCKVRARMENVSHKGGF